MSYFKSSHKSNVQLRESFCFGTDKRLHLSAKKSIYIFWDTD